MQHDGEHGVDAEGWFDTGDVAHIDPEGYMQITDRSKDVIKSGGTPATLFYFFLAMLETLKEAYEKPGKRLSIYERKVWIHHIFLGFLSTLIP